MRTRNIVFNLCCNKINSKKFKNFNEFALNCQTENLITKIVTIKIFYRYFYRTSNIAVYRIQHIIRSDTVLQISKLYP